MALQDESDGSSDEWAEQAVEARKVQHDRDDHLGRRLHLHLPSNPDLDQQTCRSSELRTNLPAQTEIVRRSNMQNCCYRPGDVAILELGLNLESAAGRMSEGKRLTNVQLNLNP